MQRQIVHIDEEKCDGCGQCVSACAEGAIAIIDGKARLVADRLCDGLGACLGHCPQDAIRIETRECAPFDEAAVRQAQPAGCPSARMMEFTPDGSALTHWPIQLHLVPATAPFLRGSDLLICATCVPAVMPDFHARLLEGRTLVMACPKLDNLTGYVERLTTMFAVGGLRSVAVARVEVPCCSGLVRLAQQARAAARAHVPLREIVIGRDGRVRQVNELETHAA